MRRGFSLCGIGNVIDEVLQEVPWLQRCASTQCAELSTVLEVQPTNGLRLGAGSGDSSHLVIFIRLNNNGTDTDTLKTIAPGGVVANNDVFVEVTGAITDGTMGEAITVLNALDTSAVAIGEDVIFFVNDGTNGYLYLLTQVSTADTIAAQDLTLIGQVTGVTNVADGDFVAF